MSDEETQALEDLHALTKQWSLILKTVRVLIAGAFALGLWVATLEFRARALEGNSATRGEVMEALTAWKHKTESTRWTIQDHTAYVSRDQQREAEVLSVMRDQNNIQELRLQRLEYAQANIEKEISGKLQVTPAQVLQAVKELSGKMGE